MSADPRVIPAAETYSDDLTLAAAERVEIAECVVVIASERCVALGIYTKHPTRFTAAHLDGGIDKIIAALQTAKRLAGL